VAFLVIILVAAFEIHLLLAIAVTDIVWQAKLVRDKPLIVHDPFVVEVVPSCTPLTIKLTITPAAKVSVNPETEVDVVRIGLVEIVGVVVAVPVEYEQS